MSRIGPVALALLCGLGVAAPVLMQSCGLVRPETAADAFQAVCVAAFEAEAEKQGVNLADQAVRYCSDPLLPARIVGVLQASEALWQEELQRSDAGP